MPQPAPIDQGITWQFPHIYDLRFMRAQYVQHAFPPHAHDYFVLGIIEQGVQSFTYQRERLVTLPGRLIVINPGEIHTGEAATADGFTYRALYPTPQMMEAMAAEFAVKPAGLPEFSGGIADDAELFRWMQGLHHLSEDAPTSLELEDGLTRFFVRLMQRHTHERFTLKRYTTADRAVEIVRDYLEAHYAHNVLLSELSRLVHISPYHLARLFQRQMGIPPHRYLENVRIRQAERLLLAGTPIADIAYQTGFSSQSHLTRTFKRFIGTTPGEFAKGSKIV
ncbi:MAG: AraC family transcriptional regulator [Anaerolineae bacterium]|nr:AraC family transcriptional regulator [Anaerolineae bacterium]